MIFHSNEPYWWFVDIPFTGADYIYEAVKSHLDWPVILDVSDKYWNDDPPKWVRAKEPRPKSVIVIRNPYSRAVALWDASKRDKYGAKEDALNGFEAWLELAINRKKRTKVAWPRKFHRTNCLEQTVWYCQQIRWNYVIQYEHLNYDWNGFLLDTSQKSFDVVVKQSQAEKEWEKYYTSKALEYVQLLWPRDIEVFSSYYWPPKLKGKK